MDVRLSRTSSVERAWSFDGAAAKESEENKENLRVSADPDGDLLLCGDEEALDDSVISGERAPGAGQTGRGPAPGRGRAGRAGRPRARVLF